MDKDVENFDDVKTDFGKLQNVNKIHKEKLTSLEKMALIVTEHVGTMGFFFIIFIWTTLWLLWNMFADEKLRFDPYPAFVFWLFISNLIQLHLLPLIMIGQNIQSKHAELRVDHDFEMDQKAEKEVETILKHLNNQQNLMIEILKRIESLEKKK